MKRFSSFATFILLVAAMSIFLGCQFIPMLNFTVTYEDGVADADISVPSEATYTVGATVSINFDEIGERPGYTFKCWSDGSINYTKGTKEGLVMGMANITLTAIWELIPAPEPEPQPEPEPEPQPQPDPQPDPESEVQPQPQPDPQPEPEPQPQPDPEPDPQPEQPPAPVYTYYTVKHYKQNLNDDNYTLAYTDYCNGYAGNQTQACSRTFEHYTADPITQATIEADGSTEVRINYSLETITFTLNLEGGTLDSQTGTITRTGKYGQTVNISNPTWEGHSFSGWQGQNARYGDLPNTFTENGTFTATWTCVSGISVTFSSVTDLSITKTVTDTTITLRAISGFYSYTWMIDGARATFMPGVTTNSSELRIPISSLIPNAVYQVTLTAYRNGIPYSTQIAIKNVTN